MTILTAFAVFGLLLTICIHFLLKEEKAREEREANR